VVESGEEAELDDVGEVGTFQGEKIDGVMHLKDLVVSGRRSDGVPRRPAETDPLRHV
jgi:hypothetical protein